MCRDWQPQRVARPLACWFSRDELGRIVEELLFGDALAFPALIGQLFHAGRAAVEPFEGELCPAPNYVPSGAAAIEEHEGNEGHSRQRLQAFEERQQRVIGPI